MGTPVTYSKRTGKPNLSPVSGAKYAALAARVAELEAALTGVVEDAGPLVADEFPTFQSGYCISAESFDAVCAALAKDSKP